MQKNPKLGRLNFVCCHPRMRWRSRRQLPKAGLDGDKLKAHVVGSSDDARNCLGKGPDETNSGFDRLELEVSG